MKRIGILFGLFAAILAFVYFYEIEGAEERDQSRDLEESLLRLKQDEITSFDLQRPGQPLLRIVHQDQSWRLQEPVEGLVDQFIVDAFLRDVAAARRERTLEDVADKLGEFGLLEPRLTVTVRAGAENTQTLRVGNDDFSGDRLYAQLDGQTQVLITTKSVFSSADKELREWRSKSVLDFDQDAITQVEVEQGSQQIRLEKQGSEWRLVEPLNDRASESEVSSLLSAIKYARIDDFVNDPEEPQAYGLDSVGYRFRVKGAEDQGWKVLEVGDQKPEQETYFARDPSRPLVFTIRKTVIDKLALDASQYRDLRVIDLKQNGFDQISYRHGDVRFRLSREGAAFMFLEPPGKAGQEAPAYKFWFPLQDLSFESMADQPSVENDPRFARPTITLEFQIGDEIRLFEFAEAGEQVWARQANNGRAGTIARTEFEKIFFTPDSILNPANEN